MDVSEILANPLVAMELLDGVLPLHVIVILEYAEPASEHFPSNSRLAFVRDELLPPWHAAGMLDYISNGQHGTRPSAPDLDP